MSQENTLRAQNQWIRRILLGLACILTTMGTLFWLKSVHFAIYDMQNEGVALVEYYEMSVATFYLAILFLIPHIQLCFFAWRAMIRSFLRKPSVKKPPKKPLFHPGVPTLIFGAVTVFLFVKAWQANAAYELALVTPHEAYYGVYASAWGRWSIAALLSAEALAGSIYVWMKQAREQKRGGQAQS